MIKGNSYVLILTLILCISLFLISSIPPYIKSVQCFFTALLFFPTFREKVTKDSFRKVRVAILTSMLLPFFFMFEWFTFSTSGSTNITFFFEVILGTLFMLLLFCFYGSIGTIFYGIPASIFADYFSDKFGSSRIFISGILHIGLGFATYLIVPEYLLLAVGASCIFFMLDEIGRYRSGGFHNKEA
ncbi:hypothetical protein LG307_20000 [Sutcliffiella horikoshii]|uniref:hypothetical protein n=1 Tax=Sutcliffiella horikoshii TaxID=79883 RepID=UPI0038517563